MHSTNGDTAARNLAIVKRFYAALDAGNWTAAENIFDFDNLQLHEADGMSYGGVWQGREAFVRLFGRTYVGRGASIGASFVVDYLAAKRADYKVRNGYEISR